MSTRRSGTQKPRENEATRVTAAMKAAQAKDDKEIEVLTTSKTTAATKSSKPSSSSSSSLHPSSSSSSSTSILRERKSNAPFSSSSASSSLSTASLSSSSIVVDDPSPYPIDNKRTRRMRSDFSSAVNNALFDDASIVSNFISSLPPHIHHQSIKIGNMIDNHMMNMKDNSMNEYEKIMNERNLRVMLGEIAYSEEQQEANKSSSSSTVDVCDNMTAKEEVAHMIRVANNRERSRLKAQIAQQNSDNAKLQQSIAIQKEEWNGMIKAVASKQKEIDDIFDVATGGAK